MKREEILVQSVKDCLLQQKLGGWLLQSNSISQLYGQIVSSQDGEGMPSTVEDWATISYVQTDSAHGSGGMPDWVAEEAEEVLNALAQTKVLTKRAVWFDKLGIKQHNDWPAIATLQCLATPVICVPPTRTLEYSRFQVPDNWDTATFDFFVRVEDLLRSCSRCGPKCPLEYDSRLLNIAAALRAWPINDAIMASSSRGAFVSFATLDRIQYTIAWYQVLLHLALALGEYGAELHARSIELYGNALFHPCAQCLSLTREHSIREAQSINCQVLDDALAALLLQTNRFCMPWARSDEGVELWSYEGLQRSPGEAYRRGLNNHQRLKFTRRAALSQTRLEEIAANIIRGRPALSSCYRQGDKWLCGLVLSNLDSFLCAFRSEREHFDECLRLQMLRLLKLDRPFGELSHRDSWMETGGDRSVLSPACDGQRGSICFFNELSGILPPSALGEFLRDRDFSSKEKLEILRSTEQSLRRRIHVHGIGHLCYELKNGAVRKQSTGHCAGCSKPSPGSDISMKKMILVGWRAKKEILRSGPPISRERYEETVYSFIAVDVDDVGHAHSRGTFNRSNAVVCDKCRSTSVRVEIEDTCDLLEVHISKSLPIARALTVIYESLNRCHHV